MDKHILPCQCAGTCKVSVITEYESYAEDPQEFYVDWYQHIGNGNLWWRLKEAFKVARGKDPYFHAIVLDPEQVKGLRDWINSKVTN